MNLNKESGMFGFKPVGSSPEPGTPKYYKHRKIKIIGIILSVIFIIGMIALALFLR